VIVSSVLWMLLTIPMPGAKPGPDAPPIESSIAATVGRTIEPVTRPAGFDWRIDVGLIGSFGARELMVATLGVVFGIEDAEDDATPLAQKLREAKRPDGSPVYGVRTGLALLAFFVLACQCMSTVAAIRRETSGWKWPAFVVGYTYALGYVAAVLVYQIGGALGVP
jgi:ferrous iron transport protein B